MALIIALTTLLLGSGETPDESRAWELAHSAAVLFAEHSDDDTVLATVEGIEELTTGMSRTIWQTISLLRAANAS